MYLRVIYELPGAKWHDDIPIMPGAKLPVETDVDHIYANELMIRGLVTVHEQTPPAPIPPDPGGPTPPDEGTGGGDGGTEGGEGGEGGEGQPETQPSGATRPMTSTDMPTGAVGRRSRSSST